MRRTDFTSASCSVTAPLPRRRYLGEIRAQEVRPAGAPPPLRYTHCIACGNRLPTENHQPNGVPTRSLDLARMDPGVRFCGLRCAARYGCRATDRFEAQGTDLRFPNLKG